MHRVGVVLHPTRPVQRALDTLRDWTAAQGLELVQLEAGDGRPRRSLSGEVAACDLVAAVGGDGTVLAALHAAAPTGTPVLGVACGSLGALSTVSEDELRAGLDRVVAGEWWPRRLPALVVETGEGQPLRAVNDVVLVRRGGTQLLVEVSAGHDLYARMAGDGVVVATPLGSSAYSMAAGGPVIAAGTDAFLCTPLAMHGGCAPPLVVPAETEFVLQVDPGWGGFDLELDGHSVDSAADRFAVSLERDYATLVGLGDTDSGVPRLRKRGLVTDSPRVLARDARARSAVRAPK